MNICYHLLISRYLLVVQLPNVSFKGRKGKVKFHYQRQVLSHTLTATTNNLNAYASNTLKRYDIKKEGIYACALRWHLIM